MRERGSGAALDSPAFLRALVDVAGRNGVETSAEQLRRMYALGDAQTPVDTFVAIAQELGLKLQPLDISWASVSRLRGAFPALIELRDGSWLIVEGMVEDGPQGAILLAREAGAQGDAVDLALDEQRFGRLCSGRIMLAKRGYRMGDAAQPFSMRWIAAQILTERALLRDIGIASLVLTFVSLFPPVLTMIVVDRVLVNHSFSTLAVMAGALAMLIAFEMVTGYTRRLALEAAATRIDGRLSLYLLDRLLALPLEFFERNPTGLIQAKLAKIQQIRTFLTGRLLQTALDLIVLAVVVPILFALNWALTLAILSLASVLALIVYAYAGAVGRRFRAVVAAEQRRNTHLVETIYGIRAIKSLAIEGRRRGEWDALVARSVEARYRLGSTANIPQTLSVPFERLIFAGVFLLGAWLTLARPDMFLPGALMAFIMLGNRATQPIVQLAQLMQDVGEIREAVHDVGTVVNAPPERTRSGTGLRQPVSGAIDFRGVSFRYAPGAPLALDDVTLEVPAGTILGIMGRSGSGKTTITRLLQGLNPDFQGIIKVDGMDLREMDLHHLRTHVGVVAQESFLFSGTIRENIGIAKPHARFSEIVRAAQLAGAEEFIERLPRGYDTMLAEGAANLSGGQRQRLAIARALILDPPILILDEATSALDAESEAIINANLMRIAHGRTIVCVSHRLAMLVNADRIAVMEKGRIDDVGSHSELLGRNEIYQHMWFTQNRPAEGSPGARIAIAHHR